MATKKTTTIKVPKQENRSQEIMRVKQELSAIRLDIKAGVQKNTNAHKQLKKKLAQLLTQK